MWWCHFIEWLKFETRPSSLRNFRMANIKTLPAPAASFTSFTFKIKSTVTKNEALERKSKNILNYATDINYINSDLDMADKLCQIYL